MKSTLTPAATLAAFLLVSGASHAEDMATCATIDSDRARLQCYDRVAGRGRQVIVKPAATEPGGAPLSLLESAWELERNGGTYRVRPYKPVYLLPYFQASHVNRAPHTASHGTVDNPPPVDSAEAKFQLSFKTKLIDDIFPNNGDLWAGYTQSSRWQVYNAADSRPFRETNYEPEVMFIWRTDFDILGFKARYLSIGANHQSNGRSGAWSRSWNRTIGAIGLERGDWTLTLRPWWRLPERAEQDDNPDIADYAGRGELLLTRVAGNHVLSLQARHSLRGGDRSHGSLEFDWAFPLDERLRGHFQWHAGYAESLIDYNHRATYLGLGLSLVEWY